MRLKMVVPLLAVAATLRVAPAAADPVEESVAEIRAVAGGDLSVRIRDGQPAVRFLGGRLTARSTTDVRGAAKRFIDRHERALGASEGTAVVFERAQPLRTGIVLRYRQRIDGVPVVGAEATFRFDRSGILRIVHSSMRPFREIAPSVPRIGSANALATIYSLPDVVAPADPAAAYVGLVYYPAGDEARLAWQVEPGAVPAFAANWVAWVDAHTGAVLAKRNRIYYDRLANVFDENPVSTPTMTEVTLDDLPPWTADPYYLTSEFILARNCPDLHHVFPVSVGGFTLDAHLCTETQVAAGDVNHDFLFDDYEDTAPEDLFAEATMFYHVAKAYDFFRSLGFDRLRETPLACTVNFRIPVDLSDGFGLDDMTNAQNPDGLLYPFDNAFFLPAGDASAYLPRDADSIVFGQGTHSDFAYDGDVVYHEFGHAVVDSTSGLAAATIDDQGLDIGPGALNEGYADVFSMFMTQDPLMGEYAGGDLPPAGAIRDLEPDRTCPGDMIGEVHVDSLPWTSAAWDIWSAFGGDAIQPYYDAMVALTANADFSDAVAGTVTEIDLQMGATAALTARGIFESRNIVECERVLEGGRSPRPLLMGEGTNSVGLTPYVPGYAMFRIPVPAGQVQIRVHFDARAGGMGSLMGGSIAPYVLFRQGPERLRFRYLGTRVEGNETYAVDATLLAGAEYEAVYCEIGAPPLPAGDYFVMIANRGGGSMEMRNISVRYNNSTPDAPCVGEADAGDGEADVVEDVADAEEAADAAVDLCNPPSRCDEECRASGAGTAGRCEDTAEGPRCFCNTGGGGDGCGCATAGSGVPGLAAVGLVLTAIPILLRGRRRPSRDLASRTSRESRGQSPESRVESREPRVGSSCPCHAGSRRQ